MPRRHYDCHRASRLLAQTEADPESGSIVLSDCPICQRKRKPDTKWLVCDPCATRVRQRLADLPALHKEAHYCLQPQRGGHGTNSGEPTSGVNITALDFVAGQAILNLLHEWEKLIRAERQLAPPALIPKQPSIEAEVLATVTFHIRHLPWTLEQNWCDEYIREIAQLHSTGMAAARRFVDPTKRIPCPTTVGEHETCNFPIPVKGNDLLEPVDCKRCKTQWTPARLIAVAMTTPGQEVWLDIEAISGWVGLSEKQVRRICKKLHIPKRGQLFDVVAFQKARFDK